MLARRLCRQGISYLICLSLALITPAPAFGAETPIDAAMARAAQDSTPKKFNEFADKADRGDLAKEPLSNFDVFRLAGQRVEVYRRQVLQQTVNLDDLRVQDPVLAYTRVRAYFKAETRELVLEATRGENDRGENGEVVARQFIPNMDIVALTQDNELISFVDSAGRLHALDMGYVSEQLFRSPIPVFQNLWEPRGQVDLRNVKVEIAHLTRGVLPFAADQIPASAPVPRNSAGAPALTAGDVLVTVQNGGTRELYGVFARKVTYERIVRGSRILQWLASVVATDPNEAKAAEAALKDLEQFDGIVEAQQVQNTMAQPVREALVSIGKEQVASLRGRVKKNTGYIDRRRDQFSLEEWEQSYAEFFQKFELVKANAERDKARVPELAEEWGRFVTPVATPPAAKKSVLAAALSRFKNKRVLGAVFAAGTVGYFALPFAVDAGLVDNIKSVLWFYQNFFPAVLKDAEYRTPLILSMTALMALWPMGEAISVATGRFLKKVNQMAQGSSSRVAGVVRDFARGWLPLDTWQRINTFGFRLYATWVYPYFKVLINSVLRQKSFLVALENNLNPFESVAPQSDLGQLLGLKEAHRVGVNNPFVGNESLERSHQEQMRIQSTKVEIQKRRQSLAWLLATLVVSEDQKVDLATLIQMGPTGVKISDLEALLSDEAKKKEWYHLVHMINKELKKFKTSEFLGNVDQLSAKEIAEFYDMAKNAAQKLKAMPNAQKKINELWYRFKRTAFVWKNTLLRLGEKEHAFLKNVYASPFVSTQVKQEFVTDHAMVVGVYGLWGERADLAHPRNLSADPNGLLWTSGPHLYDVGLNTLIHFFISGSRMALVFQSVQAKDELRYMPIEDLQYVPVEKRQGFMSTAGQWVADVLDFERSDIGGVMVKRLWKTFATIQAGLTLNLVLRYGLADQTLSQAFAAWMLMFTAGQWYFGWVWDPVQRGNQMQEERIDALKAAVQNARSALGQGLRQANTEEGQRLIEQGAVEMRALYHKHSPKTLELAEQKKGSALDAQELLTLSVISSPVYTTPHPFVTWLSTWNAALWSTVLAVPLSVLTFQPEALTASSIMQWIGISAGLYTASYFAFGGKPWKYYNEKWNLKNKIVNTVQSCASLLTFGLVKKPGGDGGDTK